MTVAVRMGTVWDRTVEVLSGRGTMLYGIAAATIFAPTVLRDAWLAYAGGADGGGNAVRIVGILLSVAVLILTIWGQLAIIAAASDPSTDRTAALRIGGNRLLPAIGVSIVLGIALFVSILPAIGLLAASGMDFAAMAAGQTPSAANMSGGALAGALLYLLVWTVALIWVGAKLFVWQPTLVNERIGLRAPIRSWHLTAGSAWRILGVLILFVIVLLVAVSAAQFVSGIVFRLILGAGGIRTAIFLAGVIANIVSTILVVLAIVFSARLYDSLVAAHGDAPVRA